MKNEDRIKKLEDCVREKDKRITRLENRWYNMTQTIKIKVVIPFPIFDAESKQRLLSFISRGVQEFNKSISSTIPPVKIKRIWIADK